MSREFEISPEPSAEDRDAILAAVAETLRREEALARPSLWRLQGWLTARVGISDLPGAVPAGRRWALSSFYGRGGRVYPGLQGRGDAK